MKHRKHRSLALPLGSALLALSAPALAADRTIDDYRYFRALSIDLAGRIPTRAELAAFEADGFDTDKWIDDHLTGEAYAERLRRVYMDLMRLELNNTFKFNPNAIKLQRTELLGPDGKPFYLYFRPGQRRARPETDKGMCFTKAESGIEILKNKPFGTATAIAQKVLDDNTVVIKPWWLYRDYKSTKPKDLYSAMEWQAKYPNFRPLPALLSEADGSPTTSIRVCKEEAQTSATGTTSGGATVSCGNALGVGASAECGCGVGLEACFPGTAISVDPQAFTLPQNAPLGLNQPFDESSANISRWSSTWWSQEFTHFFDDIVTHDRDFRDLLTSRATVVNGPLTQFYGSLSGASCCSQGQFFGYQSPEPLFDPANLPSLLPHDTDQWVRVEDRGSRAAGILTMPIFLTKYGTRRARAHVLYNTFLCRDFIAEKVDLPPSTESNLMIRPGCSTCHVKLEPLAAYYTRVVESDWTYLPEKQFPVNNPKCAKGADGKINASCSKYYDPAFTDGKSGKLRGAYGSPDNAAQGPIGLAEEIVGSSDYPVCVARNIASSFLGHPLGADEAELATSLAGTFVSEGYHLKALVKALVKADAYKRANNLSGSVWRGEGGTP